MVIRCQECGGAIETEDYYELIRRKYCRRCAEEVRRRQNAERMRELRRTVREQHKAERTLCAAQREELDLLRDLIIQQREQIRSLKEDLLCK